MLIADMMKPVGRVFLKSEFGPIGDQWPCFSFTRKLVGDHLRAEYRPGRDIVIYVGTTDPKTTQNPDHRSRLASWPVPIQPNQVLETRKIVPDDQWQASVAEFGQDRWPFSMAVIDAALTIGPPFPDARVLTPTVYLLFAAIKNRGYIVEALGTERESKSWCYQSDVSNCI